MAGSSKTVQFSAESTGSDFRIDMAVWVRWDVGDILRHLKYEGSIVEKRFRDLFSFIIWRRTRFSYLESAYACVNAPKLRMKNWWKYDENSSSDARRGHLRISKFPNFQRGKASPFDPRCHCVDVAGPLLWGIRARQLVLFFTIRQVLDCGQAGMWYCEFIIWSLHFRSSSS